MSINTKKRRETIYQEILSKGSVRVNDLAQLLNVTGETIRKDLNFMDEQGLVNKTHGGAEIKNEYYQLPVDVKMSDHIYEKELIARSAIKLIKDNSVVYLDPSTISLKIARYLPLRKGLTVVTNSLAVAQAVLRSNHDLILVGGHVVKQSNAAIGTYANSIIDSLKIDMAFNGTDGFYKVNGPSTFSAEEMEVKMHVIKRSTVNVLIAEKAKFKKSATYTYASYEDFDILLTNDIEKEEQSIVDRIPKVISVNTSKE